MSDGIGIRPAAASDFETAKSWLSAAGLPSADLTTAHLSDFLIAVTDGAPIGMVGIERIGSVALMRSLVVAPRLRSVGVGGRLVSELEVLAKSHGVVELWLLTIDADEYFSKLRYERRQRSEAPVEIQGTEEFSSLCPGDAVLMSKLL
jgi:amino-acid N-acetyltransferase